MENQPFGVSPYTVNLSRIALKRMVAVVRGLQDMSENSQYFDRLKNIPVTAQTVSNHHAVLMGYDFHVTDSQQVKLIEVNTNAGGLWLAQRCYQEGVQQDFKKTEKKVLDSFNDEFQSFCNNSKRKLQLIAIVDQQPHSQFLYPEMQAFAQLFQQAGVRVVIIDPSAIEAKKAGLYYQGQVIDLIYNRHCDFYLKTAEMSVIREAWQKQWLCLTPNPRVYGVLADKQRMVDWSVEGFFESLLSKKQAYYLKQAIIETRLMASFSEASLWATRKQWVFKPINSYASQGVYVGKKLTKSKFNSFCLMETLVQKWVKPSVTISPEGSEFKTDFRLFVYRKRVLAVSARIYRGQVTNLRTQNGGFCKVKISR